MEERRMASMEAVMISLGRLEESTTHIKETVTILNERVGIQNGKVGKLMEWKAFIQGVVALLIVFVVPIALNFAYAMIKYIFDKQF